MADPQDVQLTKMLRREMNRRMMDTGQTILRVMHGVAYIQGVVKPLKGGPTDLKAEIELVGRILRQRGIKDVVIDCTFRS